MIQLSTIPSIGGGSLQIRRRSSGSPRLSYIDAVKLDHPEVFWPLNDAIGSLTAQDASGHSFNGALAVGHQTLTFGAPGYTSDGATALQQTSAYNAADPAAVATTTASVGTGNQPFSLEAAAGSIDTASGPALVGIGGSAVAQQFWFMYVDAAVIGLRTLGNGWTWPHGIAPASAFMHLYSITYDGAGNPHAYVDGTDLGIATIAGAPSPNLVGAGVYANGDVRAGDGSSMVIADVAAYNYTLTPAQIAVHAAAR